MTQGGDQVADEDANIDEDQGPVTGDVQDSIVVGRAREIHASPVGSLLT